MMSFDLADFTQSLADSAWLKILNPKDNSDTGLRFHLAGPDSEIYRRAESAARNKSLARQTKTKLTAEMVDEQVLEHLLAVTIGWEGLVYNGQPLEFTSDNLRHIYTEPRLRFIREQVEAFVSDRQNFFSA
ncbi:MAG: hypothetical protein LBV79_04525 [Candidatus Adiutrix sp.]|jgi:hypothetical protein|nr:hypothetical protein [Candidatus Adiutrix sp.]